MHAWIVGATGLVGKSLLAGLLAEPRIEKVTAIVRRPLERADPKLQVLTANFDDLEGALAEKTATLGFCCLGTTIKKAGSQDAFRRVDHAFPLAFGRACKSAGARKLLVVTAVGADPASSVFYNRVKGEVERDLGALALPELHLFRPSLLLGDRAERRAGEAVAMALFKPLGVLMVGRLARYRAVQGEDVARAMLNVALATASPVATTVHESEAIPRLARGES